MMILTLLYTIEESPMPIYFLDEMKWKYLEAEIAKRGL